MSNQEVREELATALETERARLDWLDASKVNYIPRGAAGLNLIETDCGAMICHGSGEDLRTAIDAARAREKGAGG